MLMVHENKQEIGNDKYWDREIETLSRDRIKKLQEERLKDQLKYVYKCSPFYRDIFDRNKLKPNDIKSIEDVLKIPITHKDELRKSILKSNNPLPHICVPRDRIYGFGCSRGTTGEPTFSGFTKKDIDLRVECYTRSLFQLGLSKKDSLHSMIGITSITHFILRDVARNLGITYINDGVDNLSISIHIGKWLKPTALITGVRTILDIEKVLEKENQLPKDIFDYKKAILYGDVVESHLINHVKEKWGFLEVFSLGGSAADLLWFNFDCLFHSGNHCLNEDMFLIEVINPRNGVPVKEGEKGMLVVTDLLSKGAPHIRWNLEDFVIPFYEPCLCGRTHMRLKYLGRALYEVNIKGKEIFPIEIEHILWNIKEIKGAEFRVVKYANEMEYLKLQIELSHKERQKLKEKIISELQERLEVDVEIEFLNPGELPSFGVKTPRIFDLTLL